ncbi:MAG: MarR family transcriptional regulator [Clostridia bacterium]|nr:MarR family transcriptional regulator [Clostridia bacterium]
MESFDPLKLENQLCFPLYAASREVVRQYYPQLEAIGLTYTQYITMMVLWEARTISSKKLGERLFLDSGTLTPVLKSLEAKGWLIRKRSAEDERVLLVSLTDAGAALKEEAMHIPATVAGCIRLSPEEAGELYRLLYKMLNAFRT